jgi:hypothetical protein
MNDDDDDTVRADLDARTIGERAPHIGGPLDTTGSPFVPALCQDCGAHVVAAPGHAGATRCLDCARAAVGINWPSGKPVGQWQPGGSGVFSTTTNGEPAVVPTIVLACIYCPDTWAAPATITPTQIGASFTTHERVKHPDVAPPTWPRRYRGRPGMGDVR